jgi:hypothetical protein
MWFEILVEGVAKHFCLPTMLIGIKEASACADTIKKKVLGISRLAAQCGSVRRLDATSPWHHSRFFKRLAV